MAKKKTSLAFEEQLFKQFRKKCIDEDKQITQALEELMQKWINKKN